MNYSFDAFLPYGLTNTDDSSLLPCLKEINESKESKSKCLEILRLELKSIKSIEFCLEDNFLLRFLRVSKYNTSKALQRIMKYYQHQEVLLDALNKVHIPLHKAQSLKYAWLSPYRMKNGSYLLFALGGKIDYSKVTFAERFCLDIMAANKVVENPVNQIAGATVLFDYEGFNFQSFLAHTPGWLRLFLETFVNAFPARIKAIHVVNTPSLFLTAFKMANTFLSKKVRERLLMHPNDGWKSLHLAIPPEILPEEYGGKLKFESCINVLKNIEELDERFHEMLKFGYIKTKTKRQSFCPIRRKN